MILGVRRYRFCPVCKRSTYVDGDKEERCNCGWHERSNLVLPKPGNANLLVPAGPRIARPATLIKDNNRLLVRT